MKSLLIALGILCTLSMQAQLTDACKLEQGMNLGGLADWGTELPFVDLMHNAREWYTKDVDNPNASWNSEQAQNLSYRPDGYPTHIPQTIDESTFDQRAVTIWAVTAGWQAGEYTVLWDGTGELSFWGSLENLTQTSSNRITFDFNNPSADNVVEMTIIASDIDDPIHNIRVLMPGTEATYEEQPFNPIWLDIVSNFQSVRFMDWGQTNNWGQGGQNWDDPTLFAWEDRARMDNYTWANDKGIPYEMMIKLMNDYDLNGWLCVPHRASNDYIQQMAEMFRDELEADKHLTVEYSNEIWNWMFGQTNWLYKYGCEETGQEWPEGIVPYVQNCLDIWSTAFSGQLDRLTRVAGVQASWQDVSNRIVNNLTTGSFDAITPTFYFGFDEEADAELDALGAAATVADVADYAREGLEEMKIWLETQKAELADPLGVDMVFYEGGQHLTGHPFGVNPTYAQALLDIQADTAMFNLYNELFDFMRTLQEGDQPLQLMNFSLISSLSSQYGSWGVLQTMTQDTTLFPAPKYSAILANMGDCTDIEVAPEEPAPTTTDIRQYIFGHSLINHELNVNPVPGDETKVPHWLSLLAQEAGHAYAATGQYGFLPQHADLPPIAQWGFDESPQVWDSDIETFAEADFNNILITAGNFMQWQPATEPYPTEDGVESPLSATIEIMDWTEAETGEMRFYIYENWPDMAGYLGDGTFPPTNTEFANYNDYVNADFHDWWIDYQDEALLARPGIYPRMIPVGPIIADLLTDTPLSSIPVTDLYEDDAPHGRPTIYFLSAMITYMAMYAEEAPASYTVPAIVHPLVATHYETTVDFIWNALLDFNDENGVSRVFFPNAILPVELVNFSAKEVDNEIELTWTTLNEVNNDRFEIEYSTDNQDFRKVGERNGKNEVNVENNYEFVHEDYSAGINYYRLKQIDRDGSFVYSELVDVVIPSEENQIIVFPNPSPNGQIQIALNTVQDKKIEIEVFDIAGRKVFVSSKSTQIGLNEYLLDLSRLEKGMYILRAEQGDFIYTEKLILY